MSDQKRLFCIALKGTDRPSVLSFHLVVLTREENLECVTVCPGCEGSALTPAIFSAHLIFCCRLFCDGCAENRLNDCCVKVVQQLLCSHILCCEYCNEGQCWGAPPLHDGESYKHWSTFQIYSGRIFDRQKIDFMQRIPLNHFSLN